MARGLAAVGIAAALAFPGWAGATTYMVNRTDDPASPSTCTPTDCTLRAAVAAVNAGAGGDMIVLPPADYTLSTGVALTLTKNVTIDGPGARLATVRVTQGGRHFQINAAVTIREVTLVRSGGPLGGGIVVNAPGRLDLQSVAMTSNGVGQGATGSVYGGGVHNDNATVNVSDSAFVSNTAFPSIMGTGHGGAIATTGSAGTTTVTNVTFAGNSAHSGGQGAGKGGALYTGPGATTTVTNATLAGNLVTAGSPGFLPTGGNIASEGTTNLRNTIVTDGSATQFGGAPALGVGNCGPGIASLGNNLESRDECGFTAAGDLRNTDALLGPLQDNGGPTDTHAITASSPAFDSASSIACPATDQRGMPRPQAGACDIGAFELAVAAQQPPQGPSGPPPDTAAPRISSLTVTPAVFRLGSRLPRLAQRRRVGGTIRFTLSEAATVRLAFTTRRGGRRVRGRCVRPRRRHAHRPRCRRTVVVGRLSVAAPAGANALRFAGRLSARKRLRPGRYTVRATAVDSAGNRSSAASARFRLLPAR